jgi:hypothetical protein
VTAEELKQRGYCCGLGCKECPYIPRNQYGNTVLADSFRKESINSFMKFDKQFNKYMEEANVDRLAQQDPREIYSDEEVRDMDVKPDLAPETDPNDAFKALEDTLSKFYALGQKGLGADADAVMERVAEILRQHEVDNKDMERFTNVLGSILLGQSVRGFADRQ